MIHLYFSKSGESIAIKKNDSTRLCRPQKAKATLVSLERAVKADAEMPAFFQRFAQHDSHH